MAKNKRIKLQLRRKRDGKTDYIKRKALLQSGKPRLIVRKALKNMILQIAEQSPSGDRLIVSASTRELVKLGWKAPRGNLPAAYLAGLLLGKKAKQKKITGCIADLGLYRSVKGSRLYAALKGVVDSGLNLNVAKEVLPGEKRINGGHIAEWAAKLKNEPEKYNKMFSAYLKQGIAPEQLPKHFEEIKKKLIA
jgi:large subunit ribosomal protein L18